MDSVKIRMRVFLVQIQEFNGVRDDAIKRWWPLVVSQHQAMVLGRKFPSAARFRFRVSIGRKSYSAGETNLKPKWIGGIYLGPAHSVPGGDIVFFDERHLWFTTNIHRIENRGLGCVVQAIFRVSRAHFNYQGCDIKININGIYRKYRLRRYFNISG